MASQISDHLVAQEMFIESVQIEPNFLACVTDLFKTQEMCNEAVRNKPRMLENVPNPLRHKSCVKGQRRRSHAC